MMDLKTSESKINVKSTIKVDKIVYLIIFSI